VIQLVDGVVDSLLVYTLSTEGFENLPAAEKRREYTTCPRADAGVIDVGEGH
jgi:hypothetical protein